MPAHKGQKKVAGRKRGTPNKMTVEVATVIANCFASIGGEDEFATWAKENRTEFYRLYAKLLPRDITAKHVGPDGGAIKMEGDFGDLLTEADLDAADRLAPMTVGDQPASH